MYGLRQTTKEILDFGDIKGIKVGGSIVGSPIMSVIFYHLDDMLVDTGPYLARGSVKSYLEQNIVKRAVLTHYHEDHAGNAKLLLGRGIKVLGHEKTVGLLKKRNRLKPYEHAMFGKLEKVDIDTVPTVVHTKRYKLISIHTPGHSCDHTVYHEPNRGWLFSGDLFLSHKIKYWRRDEDMLCTLQSLDRVLELSFETLFCGHNPKMWKPKRFIESKRQQLLDLIGQVSHLMELGLGRNEIVKSLSEGKEKRVAKWFTLGDVSYKNMVLAAMDVVLKNKK